MASKKVLGKVFYHSEKLQSTKTDYHLTAWRYEFYHSEKLQSTKTWLALPSFVDLFYHSEKLQSTKTDVVMFMGRA